MPHFGEDQISDMNSQKCIFIIEFMEPYSGEEMKQLRNSNRWGKGLKSPDPGGVWQSEMDDSL